MGWFDQRLALLRAGRPQGSDLSELQARVEGLAVCAQGAFLLELGAAQPGKPAAPPAEVQVFREGQWVEYPREGGLNLTRDHFEQCVANHRRFGTDPMVDREHESAWSFEVAVAQGWCKELRVGTDPKDPTKAALFATVEWTEPGAAAVSGRLFRYISGGIFLASKDRATGAPIGARLDHVAICCKPFIDGMQPLTNSATRGAGRDNPNEGVSMNKDLQKVLCGLLGLGEDADDKAILSAIKGRETQLRAGLAGGVVLSESACLALAVAKDADGQAVSARIVELGTKVVELAGKVAKAEDDKLVAEVDAAIAAFKYAPAEQDVQLKLARANVELWREVTALRVAQNPGGEPVVLADKARALRPSGSGGAGGAELSARQKQQMKAVDDYMLANKGVTYGEALIACAKANPALFATEEG